MRLPSARITLANDNRIVLADCLLKVLAGDFPDLSVVCVRYFDMAATNKSMRKYASDPVFAQQMIRSQTSS